MHRHLLAVIYPVEILIAREIFREVVCMIEVMRISTAVPTVSSLKKKEGSRSVYNFSFFLVPRLMDVDFVQKSF